MRIDVYLTEKGCCKSRSKASQAIAEGRVSVNGVPVQKASLSVREGDEVTVTQPKTGYVSRAGYKLEAALRAFGVAVGGKTVLDIGASTGGFTDCVLQNGAAFVYAIDVGTKQLDERLLADGRVCSRENTNARYLTRADFDRRIDLAVLDVSFISQRLLYPAIADILPDGACLISLIKPQFELGKEHIGKGGVVRDPNGGLFRRLLEQLRDAGEAYGLLLRQSIPSPITGGDGNREYLAHWIRKEI